MAPTPQTQSQRPSEIHNPTTHRGRSIAGFVVLAIIVLGLFAFAGWYTWARLRARRLGLQTPSLNPFARRGARGPSSGYTSGRGIVGWVQDKFSSGGGYTGAGVRSGRRGFGALDPDEAWDARVGAEAEYGYGGSYGEDQELGVQQPAAARGYGPSGGLEQIEGGKDGRERSRAARVDLDERYDEEMHGGGVRKGVVRNPFGDGAEGSDMRGVSPRPHIDLESPNERKSMFREAV